MDDVMSVRARKLSAKELPEKNECKFDVSERWHKRWSSPNQQAGCTFPLTLKTSNEVTHAMPSPTVSYLAVSGHSVVDCVGCQ